MQDFTRCIIHNIRKLIKVILCYIMKICTLWIKATNNTVSIFITTTFKTTIRMTIIKVSIRKNFLHIRQSRKFRAIITSNRFNILAPL